MSFLLICLITISAQDRVNKPLPIVSEPIAVLEEALGCIYDEETGQWTTVKNKITGIDHFVQYEFRELTYENKEYLLFLKYYEKGDYRYPNIKKGYRSSTMVQYNLIDKKDFEDKILSFNSNDSTALIICDIIMRGSVLPIQIPTLIPKYFFKHQNSEKEDNGIKYTLNFHFKNIPSKDISRFIFFVQDYDPRYTRHDYYSGFEYKITSDKKILDYIKKDEIFNYSYYETDYMDFNKFLRFPLLQNAK